MGNQIFLVSYKLLTITDNKFSSNFSLVAKLENPRFLTTNGNIHVKNEEREEVIPAIFRTHLEKPFKVSLI